jgi:hypothetical protein
MNGTESPPHRGLYRSPRDGSDATQAIERPRQLAPLLGESKRAGMSARRMAAHAAYPTLNGGHWHAHRSQPFVTCLA